jgi:hypothetical protein
VPITHRPVILKSCKIAKSLFQTKDKFPNVWSAARLQGRSVGEYRPVASDIASRSTPLSSATMRTCAFGFGWRCGSRIDPLRSRSCSENKPCQWLRRRTPGQQKFGAFLPLHKGLAGVAILLDGMFFHPSVAGKNKGVSVRTSVRIWLVLQTARVNPTTLRTAPMMSLMAITRGLQVI